MLLGVGSVALTVVGAVGRDLLGRGLKHLLAALHRVLQIAIVGSGGWLDLDVDDEVERLLAGLGEVDAVAAHRLVALLAIGSVFVMRRLERVGADLLGGLVNTTRASS